MAQATPHLAIISRLYPLPHRPHACAFNREQFRRLAERYRVSLLVPVPWHEWLMHHEQLVPTRRDGIDIRYAGWVFPPKVGRVLYPACFGLSLLPALPWLREREPACLLMSWAYPDAVAGAAFAGALRVPMLIKAHGSDLNVHAAHWSHALQLRLAVKRADRVVCVSEALKQRAAELGLPHEKLAVVHNGVDTSSFAPMPQREARAAIGLSPDRKVILFVGNVVETKGVRELWHAFAVLAARRSELDLLILGDGPEQAWLAAQAGAAGLRGRLRLAGRIPHAELSAWFNAADVVCLPSHNEGLPNVLLEATACGVPIVATRAGGIPEVVTAETGELVPVGDAAALATALASVLERRWDRAAFARQVARFSWQANIAAMCELIDEAMARR
jgi:glycosyltransferase involved in cell wall biosynthesis